VFGIGILGYRHIWFTNFTSSGYRAIYVYHGHDFTR